MSDTIEHYGMPRRSGRYPWGSGKNPIQRQKDFFETVKEYKRQGLSEVQIAEKFGMNTKQYRNEITWQNKLRKDILIDRINSMKSDGKSESEISKQTGLSYNTVRKYLDEKNKEKVREYDKVKKTLIDDIEKHKYIDIGIGSEAQLGVSKNKLDAIAKDMVENHGYKIHNLYVKRITDPTKTITVKVLSKEDDISTILKNAKDIKTPEKWEDITNLTDRGISRDLVSIDSKRIHVRYKEDGGEDKDGVIEVRRNIPDLDMGNAKYLQARILVDGDKYLKGMVMYSDDIPKGKDIIFNTNKERGTPLDKVLKSIKDNPDNPFGATIKDKRGALNIVNEEGDWMKWKSQLSSQFLSKQPVKLIEERANETIEKIYKDYEQIKTVKNPVVREYLLNSFNDDIRTKAAHLKLLGLPNTKSHVLLPFPELRANEVYAPNYKNGETVVLVRHPHAGRFEIAELKVNNKNGHVQRIIGNAADAIGIHPTVAKKLSGADFDGDSALVIPNNHGKIKSQDMLKGLRDFDPHKQYKIPEGSKIKVISDVTMQKQMGVISNLITDMTLKGASTSEIERAVKHSMVVIDAHKHKLDYKKSELDNGIMALKKKYQYHIDENGKQRTGASTLISKSKQPERDITTNYKTGKRIMDIIDDASKLSSGTPQEEVYVKYINKIKVLSNDISKETSTYSPPSVDYTASRIFSEEVYSMKNKLKEAIKNAPRERQAQILAINTAINNFTPDMKKKDKKKIKAQAINTARLKVGAKLKEDMIKLTDSEWDAINSNALSANTLRQILRYTNDADIKKYTTPRPNRTISDTTRLRIENLSRNGYTTSEIAQAIGVSTTTIHKLLKGDD